MSVVFVQFRYLVVGIYYPLGRVRAGLSCQRPHVPDLDLACGDDVWTSAPIVAVIVDIKIVAGSGRVSNVLHGRYDIELFARRHRCDYLTWV